MTMTLSSKIRALYVDGYQYTLNRVNNKEQMRISTDFLIIVLRKLKTISIAAQGPTKKETHIQC